MRRFVLFLLASSVAAAQPPAPLSKLAALEQYQAARATYLSGPRPARDALVAKLADPTPAATAQRLYGNTAPRVLAQLRKLGPGYDEFASSPGLVTRLPQFKKFLAAHPQGSPKEALHAFSEHLGTRTVYRALALDDQGAARVQRLGLEANFSRYDFDQQAFVKAPPAIAGPPTNGGFDKPLADTIKARIMGFSMPDHPLVSVSTNRDIAIAASTPYAQNGKQIHLYEAKVPVLDLVHPGGKRSLVPEPIGKKTLLVKRADGKIFQRSLTSAATESFVLYRIDPKEIVRASVVPTDKAATYAIDQPR